MTNKRKGSINELRVLAKLMEYGEVSIPYGNNARYDCILDKENDLIKIQIKTARKLDDNRFCIPCANLVSSGTYRGQRRVYTKEDADYIAASYFDQVYLIPTGLLTNEMTLSFEYPNNGLKKPIHIEKEYRIENVLGPIPTA